MKEPWIEGTLIQMRAVLGIKGSIWVVELVAPTHYVLLKDDGGIRRKILCFENQDNWEEVKNG